jgi:hypothetical protein
LHWVYELLGMNDAWDANIVRQYFPLDDVEILKIKVDHQILNPKQLTNL